MGYIISKIEEYIGKKAKIESKSFHKSDIKETMADISKANRLLNWSPTVSFDAKIKNSVIWYLENKKRIKDLVL